MEEEGGGGGRREGEGGRSWRRREREERRRREAGRRSGDGATRADSSRVTFVFFEFLKFFEIFYLRSPPAPLHFHLTSFQIGRKGKVPTRYPPTLLSPLTLPSFERQGGEVETEAPG